jgi:membrane-anchored protein YejM (alkaline phosphatase superfamily)
VQIDLKSGLKLRFQAGKTKITPSKLAINPSRFSDYFKSLTQILTRITITSFSEVPFIDYEISKLLEGLEVNGLAEDTVIIITGHQASIW